MYSTLIRIIEGFVDAVAGHGWLVTWNYARLSDPVRRVIFHVSGGGFSTARDMHCPSSPSMLRSLNYNRWNAMTNNPSPQTLKRLPYPGDPTHIPKCD